MSVKSCDPLHQIAEQVADCLAASGYAFVEDDKIERLAALLGSFLTMADVPINPPTPAIRRRTNEPFQPDGAGHGG